MSAMLRDCLRDPIPEIFDAARYVDAAVSAHLSGNRKLADELIRLANMPAIRVWTESLWGKGGPWTRPLPVANPIPLIPKRQRINLRMPNKVEVAALIRRDGYRCRFCGIPVVRAEIRTLMHKAYPEALPLATPTSPSTPAFKLYGCKTTTCFRTRAAATAAWTI